MTSEILPKQDNLFQKQKIAKLLPRLFLKYLL